MTGREIEVPKMNGRRKGRPPLGDRPMTDAERVARWRAKHARRLARKQQYVARSPTLEELMELVPTASELLFEFEE
jgi:hypothetical protein